VTRIKLYQDNEAPPEYLVALFSQLCSREFGPTDEEAVELGLEQTCRVWRAREMLRSPGGSSPLPSIVTQKDTYAVVSEVMDLPAYKDQKDEHTVADGVQPGTIVCVLRRRGRSDETLTHQVHLPREMGLRSLKGRRRPRRTRIRDGVPIRRPLH
jgi:hypothetical protein